MAAPGTLESPANRPAPPCKVNHSFSSFGQEALGTLLKIQSELGPSLEQRGNHR